mmetsp:Transcript_15475/g.44787  ORF Transcript_15475/g.44787 Transcript_15475/m.44787 type:complete len:102 (-) Transcript_15475:1426-1731(-)
MCDQGGEKQVDEAAAHREDEVDSSRCTNTAHQAQRRAAWLDGQPEEGGAGAYELLPDAGHHKTGRRLLRLWTVQLPAESMGLAAMHRCCQHSLVRPMNMPC